MNHITILFVLAAAFSGCEPRNNNQVFLATDDGAKQLNYDGPRVQQFSWQAGYAAFSVSQSSVDAVQRYIERQEEHHRKISFQDELRTLFKRHGIEFDEQYVWD